MRDLFSESKIQTTCLVVLAVAAVTYLIFWLRPVLVPFALALFVVSGVSPILENLENRLRVNRMIAAAITFLLGLAVLVLLGLCLWLSVLQMAQQGQAYRQRISDLTARAQEYIVWASPSGPSEVTVDGTKADSPDDLADSAIGGSKAANPQADSQAEFRKFLDTTIKRGLTQLSSELFGLVSTSVVVLIYVFFILLGSVSPSQHGGSISAIDKQVREYLLLKTLISIATGFAFGVTLWFFGVPMSLTFGVLAFLLNYIPNIGPIVASLLPIPFILLHPEGSAGWMAAAIATTMAVQVVSGSIIEPKLMGESSDLHPVVILLALMFWGMLWGITGCSSQRRSQLASRSHWKAYHLASPLPICLLGVGHPVRTQ